MIKRVFLIVLDSLGIGELPDAELFNDVGSNTLKAISKSKEFNIPNLIKLGISNIDSVDYLPKCPNPIAAYGRLGSLSSGKDTTTGHYEMTGVILDKPFPVYKDGFPDEIIEEFSERTGVKVICNKPYSGTEVIADYGKEHIKTKSIILYTSADSVMQLAAHEEYFGLDKLYYCSAIAREIMTGAHAVGRIIARPFTGEPGSFIRTSNRKDYSLPPPKDTMLDILKLRGYDVIGIGKIKDIFSGRGLSEHIESKSNQEGMEKCAELISRDFCGLCFMNLVDTDMLYGHRNDIDGYAAAVSRFDQWLTSILPLIRRDDCMIITADHGCDPSTESTDHSREYVPLIMYSEALKPINYGTRDTFADIGRTILDMFNIEGGIDGEVIPYELQ